MNFPFYHILLSFIVRTFAKIAFIVEIYLRLFGRMFGWLVTKESALGPDSMEVKNCLDFWI